MRRASSADTGGRRGKWVTVAVAFHPSFSLRLPLPPGRAALFVPRPSFAMGKAGFPLTQRTPLPSAQPSPPASGSPARPPRMSQKDECADTPPTAPSSSQTDPERGRRSPTVTQHVASWEHQDPTFLRPSQRAKTLMRNGSGRPFRRRGSLDSNPGL